MTVQEQWSIIKSEQAAGREYPTSEGWKYMTVENLQSQDDQHRVINRLTNQLPMLYEVAFYKRSRKVAYVIMRRKPVAA